MLSSSFIEMRKRNALSILQAVRLQPGLSRADVARICDLAKSTVSSVVDDLVRTEIIQETGSKTSSRGRRPVGLVFFPGARISIGISLDDDRIEMAMCNLDGEVEAVRRKKYARKLDLKSIVSLIFAELDDFLASRDRTPDTVIGLGLAVPGPVSEVASSFVNGMKLDLQVLQKRLIKKLNCDVVIDANTNMSALAESRFGEIQHSEEALIIRLGAEVRSALVKSHQVQKGNRGLAGDLGHLSMPGLRELCSCGKFGCINSLAGTNSIITRCRAVGADVEQIDDVISAALHGNKYCKKAIVDAGNAIAYGIASAINIIAPSDVMVTGKLVAAEELLANSIRSGLNEYASQANLRNCNLVFSAAQKQTEARGASLAPLQQDQLFIKLIDSQPENELVMSRKA